MTDTTMTNALRARFADEALDMYREARQTVHAPDEDITDLIVDLLHLLDTYEGRPSVSLVLDMVKTHYEEETEA